MKRPSTALRSHCQLACHFPNIHSLLQLQGHRVLLHHELVRHGVDVVHVELADAIVQRGIEEVHEVNQL